VRGDAKILSELGDTPGCCSWHWPFAFAAPPTLRTNRLVSPASWATSEPVSRTSGTGRAACGLRCTELCKACLIIRCQLLHDHLSLVQFPGRFTHKSQLRCRRRTSATKRRSARRCARTALSRASARTPPRASACSTSRCRTSSARRWRTRRRTRRCARCATMSRLCARAATDLRAAARARGLVIWERGCWGETVAAPWLPKRTPSVLLAPARLVAPSAKHDIIARCCALLRAWWFAVTDTMQSLGGAEAGARGVLAPHCLCRRQLLTTSLAAQVERGGAEDAERPLELLQHAQEAAAGRGGAVGLSRRARRQPPLVTGRAQCRGAQWHGC
jgi:hypothetical protein